MFGKVAARRIGCMILFLATPLITGSLGPMTDWPDRVLASHNRERDTEGVPPLRWNDDLALDAQAWANQLARSGEFKHAPENERHPEGENIWGGTIAYFTAESMVGAWIAEKRFFKRGVFPDNSSTGKAEDIGHYTQLMWRNSTDVGCATARSDREDLLVCRYSQAGNWRGEIPF